MSYIGDSRRSTRGPGILPLQHVGSLSSAGRASWQGALLDMRACVLGLRISSRETQGQGLGHYKYERESIGDVIGAYLWPVKDGDGAREIPAWRMGAWPVISAYPAGTIRPRDDDVPGDLETPDEFVGIPPGSIAVKDHPDTVFQGGFGPGDFIRGINPPPGGVAIAPEPARCNTTPFSRLRFLPARNRDWTPDERFQPLPLAMRYPFDLGHQKLTRFSVGMAIAADEETGQQELFIPGDLPLVTVNRRSDPKFGTLLHEMSDVDLDRSRRAPLQSFWRVVKQPEPDDDRCRGAFGGPRSRTVVGSPNLPNVIAWNISDSGCNDHTGGMVFDQLSPGDEPVIGMVNARHTGPWQVAISQSDPHVLGKDDDGHKILPVHLDTRALWIDNPIHDGPMLFEGAFPGAAEGPDSTHVHLEFDLLTGIRHELLCDGRVIAQPLGKWRWRATTYDCIYPPPIPGPSEPPLAINPTSPPGSPPAPDFDRVPRVGLGDPKKREILSTAVERSVPALLFRPQYLRAGCVDIRNVANPNKLPRPYGLEGPTALRGGGAGTTTDPSGKGEVLLVQLARSPIVGRLESYGIQLGTDNEWDYTHAPRAETGRYPIPSAPGGIVLTPPELGLEDVEAGDYDTAAAALSRTHLIIPPFVRLAFGLPSTSNGTVQDNSWLIQIEDSATISNHALQIRKQIAGQSVLRHVIDDRNISFGALADFAGGSGVIYLQNAATNPTPTTGVTPFGGGILYSSGGALHWLGTSGTDTVIAAA